MENKTKKASNSYFRSSFGRIIRELLDNLKQIYKGVHHKNLLFLYGDDFQFKNDNNFGNIDYLVDMFQNPNEKNLQSQAQRAFGINEKVNFIYSTPERYFKAAKEELKVMNNNINNNNLTSNLSNIENPSLSQLNDITMTKTRYPNLQNYNKGENIPLKYININTQMVLL